MNGKENDKERPKGKMTRKDDDNFTNDQEKTDLGDCSIIFFHGMKGRN